MASSEHNESNAPGEGQREMEIIAELIRKNYDLGEVALPTWFEATHQRRHRKMVVETSKGKFLAKTYHHKPVVIDALHFQHNLSDHLRKSGLPAARIQRCHNGRGFAEAEHWLLELQEFIEGQPMRVTSHSLAVSGDVLGRLHQVCQFVPAPPRDTLMWRFSEVPRVTFERLYHLACAEAGKETVDQHCNELAQFIHEAGAALSPDKRDTFETGLIHGDWHGGNLLFRGEELAAIIDLEFAGAGCFLEDIAYGISNLCIRTSVDPQRLRMRANILLDHYQRHRSLSYSEQVALYYAVGVKHITTVSYQIRADKPVAGLTPAQWLGRLTEQTRWLAEQSRKARWGEL